MTTSHVRLLDASRDACDAPIDRLAYELVAAFRLRQGDLVLCVAGDVLTFDAVAVEGEGTVWPGGSAQATRTIACGTPLRRGYRLTNGYVVARVVASPASSR